MKVTIDEKKGTMTIEVPLNEPTLSASRKTKLIANSGGPKLTDAKYKGNPVTINMSAWFKDNECEKGSRRSRSRDDD